LKPLGLLLIAALPSVPALAQSREGQGATPPVLRDRTGQGAVAPPLPAFATPPPVTAPPPAIIAAPDTGTMRVADLYVATEGTLHAAHPLATWQPAPDPLTGLALDHRRGEPLDAAWVRRQFVANHLVGEGIGADRIGALIQLINLAFARNGFVNSGVLLADQGDGAGDGLLRLRLIGGHLAAAEGAAIEVRWRNDHRRGLSDAFIRHRLPAATQAPLSLLAIERDFRLLADNPAIRTVNADLRPGRHPGEASLLVTVDPQPRLDAYVSASNSRSPSVGGERIAVGGSIRNTLAPGDLFSAEYGTTAGLDDFSAYYSRPLGGPGLTLQLRGGFNKAAVTDRPLVPLNIRSREYYVEGGAAKSLFAAPLLPGDTPGRWRAAQTATAGILVVHRRVTSSLLGEPFSFSAGSDQGRIEYSAIRFTGDYTRRSPDTVLAIAMTATIGIEGTSSLPRGTGVTAGLLAATPSPNFTALIVQANYARRLTPRRLELRIRLAGQAAGGILYAPERFSIGGADTVRGYRENLLLADEALVGSIGLARPFDLGGRTGGSFRWAAFTLAAFVDGALAQNRKAPQPAPTSLASTGLTLDWTPAPWLFARATYGEQLRHAIASGDVDLQDRGFQFRVTLRPLEMFRRGR
jgi:hemolysin activation/secretion protein